MKVSSLLFVFQLFNQLAYRRSGQSDLGPGSLGLPAAGVDVILLSRVVKQLLHQLQTDASVGAGHQDVAS